MLLTAGGIKVQVSFLVLWHYSTLTIQERSFCLFFIFFCLLFLMCFRTIPLLGQELGFPEPAACFIQKCTWWVKRDNAPSPKSKNSTAQIKGGECSLLTQSSKAAFGWKWVLVVVNPCSEVTQWDDCFSNFRSLCVGTLSKGINVLSIVFSSGRGGANENRM